MLSISVKFLYPYLLLLIPVFLIATLIQYLLINKKYRRTRNRIVSIICHILACVLAVFLLTGTEFVNTRTNTKNEILLLVDVSDTTEKMESQRDDLIENIIDQASYDNFNIGIVTFGYDQKYAVPFTKKYSDIMDEYKSSDLPDVSATNIAQALIYAKTLFNNPNSGKIVLISDGKETDESAKNVIRGVVAGGIKLDVCNINSSYEFDEEVEIRSIDMPDYHVDVNESCGITVNLYGNYSGDIDFKLYDNGELCEEISKSISKGESSIVIPHTFKNKGLHDINVKLSYNDEIEQNNEYTTYLYLEQYNKILILEQEDDSSLALKTLLEDENLFQVDVLNVYSDELPKSVNDLCNYDEIILNNISNSDLNDEFVKNLSKYVNDLGGGLFTVGGVDSTGSAHAYNRNDLSGTLLQQMLPVQAINYTPPVGVIVIVDRSGSMGTKDESGATLLDWARAGATSCFQALTEKDYFGLMTLDSDYNTILPPTPRTQETKILEAINSLQDATGGTVFPGAIDRAGQALRALNVDKKHIIIVSDGQVPNTDVEKYEEYAKNYYENDGITISIVGVQMSKPNNYKDLESDEISYDRIDTTSAYNKMLRLTKLTHGKLYVIENNSSKDKIVSSMREDLNSPAIKEVDDMEYNPIVRDATNVIFNNVELTTSEKNGRVLPFKLTGFNGTKIRENANLLLTADYNVPVYAQWKYGNGTVGSLMCDLNNVWSTELLLDDNGVNLVKNIVKSITPTKNIRSNDITLSLIENNYTNSLSVFTTLNEGEYLTGEVKYDNKSLSLSSLEGKFEDGYTLISLNSDNNYSRSKFVLKAKTTYEIYVYKYNANNELIGQNFICKSLGYSSEYEIISDEEELKNQMSNFASIGNGVLIEDLSDPHEIIDSFDLTYQTKFDPRYLFAILIIILFLIDFAVRKFKFKWPHEIIHEKRRK